MARPFLFCDLSSLIVTLKSLTPSRSSDHKVKPWPSRARSWITPSVLTPRSRPLRLFSGQIPPLICPYKAVTATAISMRVIRIPASFSIFL